MSNVLLVGENEADAQAWTEFDFRQRDRARRARAGSGLGMFGFDFDGARSWGYGSAGELELDGAPFGSPDGLAFVEVESAPRYGQDLPSEALEAGAEGVALVERADAEIGAPRRASKGAPGGLGSLLGFDLPRFWIVLLVLLLLAGHKLSELT